jgi:fumarate hydratase class II
MAVDQKMQEARKIQEAEHMTRIEHDSMGAMAVPGDALYGAQTARAVENFPISALRLQRPFIRALGRLWKLWKAVTTRSLWWMFSRPAAALRRT